MRPFKTDILRLCTAVLCILALPGCIEDLSKYDYKDTNKVSFQSVLGGFIYSAGEDVELVAPVVFSKPVADPDSEFDIEWFLDRTSIGKGYRLTYNFNAALSTALVLKVTNKQTGEVYLSDSYSFEVKSAIGWGWMILSDMGDGKSSISFIHPVSHLVSHNLEANVEGGIGQGPLAIYYYYVQGSIPGSYISGLPKIIINQTSGTVTLDGQTLERDMYLKDEFENASEPAGLEMSGFAYKNTWYAICSADGDLYVRDLDSYENKEIPYYGKYRSMPYDFGTPVKLTCFQGFHNVTYNCADDDKAIAFDQLSGRFVCLVKGNDTNRYNMGSVIPYNYDQDYQLPASVTPINSLGAGTRCLALGAYEKMSFIDVGGGYSGFDPWSEYVALLDMGGSGDYQVYCFGLHPLSFSNHLITTSSQTAFSGGSLLTDESVILMSSDFEKNPYFFFTDGDRRLYLYSMEMKSHRLLYEAPSKITHLCTSPLQCAFGAYGGNNTLPNWRLAAATADGTIEILDVSEAKKIAIFEGRSVNVKLGSFTGFGDVKGVVWCTNYEGEY